jgi:hydrogenase-4 component H
MVFSWIRKGLRTGILTTRFPAVHERISEDFRGRPVLDASRCLAVQGCNACVQICLPGALSLTEVVNGADETSSGSPQLTLDYARCIMCGLCVTACPADAMQMRGDYELATRKLEDLRLVTVFAPSTSVDSENGKEKNDGRSA